MARKRKIHCEVCGQCCACRADLETHKRVHTDEKPFECDECGDRFKYKTSLRVHILRQHAGEKPYKCDICEVRYTTKQGVRAHILRHTGEKLFKCDICGMPLGTRQALKDHKMRHTGAKPFACDICGVKFRQKQSMISHRLRHTGEKPFKCDVCEMAFNTRDGLRRHKPKHGERKFECDVCKYRFYMEYEMETHKARVHKREQRVKCTYCPRDFSARHMMLAHLLKQHFVGLKCFSCPMMQCTEAAMSYTGVQVHFDENHNIGLDSPAYCKLCNKAFKESRYFLFHFYADHVHEQVATAIKEKKKNGTEMYEDGDGCAKELAKYVQVMLRTKKPASVTSGTSEDGLTNVNSKVVEKSTLSGEHCNDEANRNWRLSANIALQNSVGTNQSYCLPPKRTSNVDYSTESQCSSDFSVPKNSENECNSGICGSCSREQMVAEKSVYFAQNRSAPTTAKKPRSSGRSFLVEKNATRIQQSSITRYFGFASSKRSSTDENGPRQSPA